MQSGKLQNALKNLRAAIKDVEAAVEEMRAEKDSLAGLPSVMWSVVLQGAALVIGITYLLRVQHAIQFVLTGCLAMFIGTRRFRDREPGSAAQRAAGNRFQTLSNCLRSINRSEIGRMFHSIKVGCQMPAAWLGTSAETLSRASSPGFALVTDSEILFLAKALNTTVGDLFPRSGRRQCRRERARGGR